MMLCIRHTFLFFDLDFQAKGEKELTIFTVRFR